MRFNKAISVLIAIVILLNAAGCNAVNNHSTQASQAASPSETAAIQAQEPSPSPAEENTVKPNDDYLLQDQCILSYISALKGNDLDNILRLCTSEDISANIKKTYGLEYIGDLYRASGTHTLITTTKQFIYSLLLPENSSLFGYTRDVIDKFIKDVDPSNLKNIQVLMLGTPKVYPSGTEFKIDTNYYVYRYCLFSYGEKIYYQGFLMQKIGNAYKLVTVGFLKDSFYGATKRTIEYDFKNLIITDSLDIPSGDFTYNTNLYGENETFVQIFKKTESPVFKTSVEAANYYSASIAKGDTYSTLGSFDIIHRAENVDLFAISEVLTPNPLSDFPSEYEFYKDINIAYLAGTQAITLFNAVLYLTSYDLSDASNSDLTKMLSFLKQNYGSIANLKIKKTDLIASSLTKSGQELSIKQAKRSGADNKEYRIIEYQAGKKTFIGGMEILNYGGNWLIYSDSTGLLPIAAYVPVVPSDKLNYNSYIKK